MSEGSTGSEFFVIIDGDATVSRRGRKVATLGPGDAFGELALLDKAPRNATVTAQTPMEVVVLGQREFGGLIDEVPGLRAQAARRHGPPSPGVGREIRPVSRVHRRASR